MTHACGVHVMSDDFELFEIDVEVIVTETPKAVMIRHPSGPELWLPKAMVIEMGEESILVPMSFAEERGIADVIARAEARTAVFAKMAGVGQ